MRYLLFVILTLGLTAFIGWGTYQTALALRRWQPDRNLLLLPAENVLRLGLIVICVGLGQLSGLPATTLGWTTAQPLADIAIGVVAGVALSLALTWASRMAVERWGQAIYSPLVILNVLPRSRGEWVLVLLALVPAVALEELLFRSLLLGGLSPWIPAGLLVLGFSLLFGLMHLPQGALGVAGTALAGCALSLLFLWRGSLLVPLVAHYVADVSQLAQAERARVELAAMNHAGASPGANDA